MLQVSTTEAVGAALLGAPLAGLLAERVFGYIPPKRGGPHEGTGGPNGRGPAPDVTRSGDPPEEGALENAEALSQALLLTTVGPWLLSIGIYFILMSTYKTDRKMALDLEQQQQRSSSSTAAATAATAAADLELGSLEDEDGENSDLELIDPRDPLATGGPLGRRGPWGAPTTQGAPPYYIKVPSSLQHAPEGGENEDCPSLAVAADDDRDNDAAAGGDAAAVAAPQAAAAPGGVDPLIGDSSPSSICQDKPLLP